MSLDPSVQRAIETDVLEAQRGLDYDSAVRAVENPQWEDTGRTHDWRNYVSDSVMGCWGKLSLETRLIVWTMAKEQANRENWE